MLKLISLSSSSKGNCHLLTDGSSTLMLDCGKIYSKIQGSLQGINIDGVLITHEHGDHMSGIKSLLDNKDTLVYSSPGTIGAIHNKGQLKLWHTRPVSELKTFCIGSFNIVGFEVRHDAAQPFNYLIKHDNGATIAYITDTGYIKNINVSNVDYLLIECNFDEDWYDGHIEITPEMEFKRQRLMGDKGHLSIQQCIEFINKIKDCNLKKVILCHISAAGSADPNNIQDYKEFAARVKRETNISNVIALDPKMNKPLEICLTDSIEIPKFE